jgi:hypothetical protein
MFRMRFCASSRLSCATTNTKPRIFLEGSMRWKSDGGHFWKISLSLRRWYHVRVGMTTRANESTVCILYA